MKAVYFAWVRERIGKSEEILAPPAEVTTAGELIQWLTQKGDEYAYAFENPKLIRIALDRAHVTHDTALGSAHEVAFFPPMTGG